jgi:hypothetical protein
MSDLRIVNASHAFELLQDCSDEGDSERLILALGDRRITTPSLRLGLGSGSVNACVADQKHLGSDWSLMKPYNKKYGTIAPVPLRVAIRSHIPRGIEYRMTRKRNPLTFEKAVSIAFGQLKLVMKAKKFTGNFADPENLALFDRLNKPALRQHTLNQIQLSLF